MKLIAQSENIENVVDKDSIYVDKTEYIYNLTKQYDRVFFSRPRRFGKSLTLNTIGTLFEKGVDPYFKGTWIYDKWDQDKYPVLHLNFLRYRTTNVVDFKEIFSSKIAEFADSLKLEKKIKSKEPDLAISELFSALDEKRIVILIDEYDCQLTANINNPELYEKFRTCIREFYAALKGAKQIRFLAVTGVTRLKEVSIFSVGSDIKDLSYENDYSTMIGFTRDEIKKFYIDYLKLGVSYENNKSLESVTDSEIENLLDRMADYYDCYCFDEFNQNKVFSTYSVNGFLQDIYEKKTVRFGDYWYDVGGLPSILTNYIASFNLNEICQLLTSEISIPYNDFMNPTSLIDINENVLMCQTGYLTLKSEIVPGYAVTLGTANREVNSALFMLLGLRIFDTTTPAFSLKNRYVIETGSVDEIISLFNEVLAALAYDKYPVGDEFVLRALLQVYLIGKNHDVRVEQHNYKGRSDILVNFPKRRVVLELKYTDKVSSEKAKLSEAENQIKEKGYGLENLGDRELIQIACVFNGDKNKRQITMYKKVENSVIALV
jgi:hypothetical protein